eukprot:CAMPEP_0115429878 /NCGR_PEP_ID=MMETSP0271-20121206/30750_1 /TAXON_ID=71861 /ORGANISM="Scrippsiella trochoidea, Strain CCMP3099" /LENGTH=356 /DNA_ID=CAMNT_0002855077 /DNA_START=1 /DNA_END=1067 /DNA_ORIENTATION=-
MSKLPAATTELPHLGLTWFNKVLRLNYGSVYSGWVHYLDIAGHGKVSESEFGHRAKAIGAAGSVHQLFKTIDQKGKGYITLQDLDAEVHQAVTTFMRLAEERCGSLADCWAMFDFSGRGCVAKEDFIEGCAELDYPGDAEKLFGFLRPTSDRASIYLEDLGPKGVQESRQVFSQDVKEQAVLIFVAFAEEKCGSLKDCWPKFDARGVGYVLEAEFIRACKSLDYKGDAQHLFRCLAPDVEKAMLFLQDLGPKGQNEARRLAAEARKADPSSPLAAAAANPDLVAAVRRPPRRLRKPRATSPADRHQEGGSGGNHTTPALSLASTLVGEALEAAALQPATPAAQSEEAELRSSCAPT